METIVWALVLYLGTAEHVIDHGMTIEDCAARMIEVSTSYTAPMSCDPAVITETD